MVRLIAVLFIFEICSFLGLPGGNHILGENTEIAEAEKLDADAFSDFLAGKVKCAEAGWQTALAIARKCRDYELTCAILRKLGFLNLELDRHSHALKFCKEALNLGKSKIKGNPEGLYQTHEVLTQIFGRLGQYDKSIEHGNAVIAGYARMGKKSSQAHGCITLARIGLFWNDLEFVEKQLENANKIHKHFRRTDFFMQGRMNRLLLESSILRRNLVESKRLFKVFARSEPNDPWLPVYRAQLRLLEKDYSEAIRHLGNDLEHLEYDYLKAEAQNVLALAYLERKQFAKASVAARHCLKLRRKTFGKDHPRIGEALLTYSNTMNGLGQIEEAKRLRDEGVAILTKHSHYKKISN